MIHPLALTGPETSAWVAALAGAAALITQAVQAWRKRHREREEIDVALDQQPMVRQQLELGNVGEAVKHLNVIINSQAEHIKTQDSRQQECDQEIDHLRKRNEALERKAAEAETKYRQIEQRMLEMETQYTKKINELERSYMRSLAVLKSQMGNNEPDHLG